MPMAAVSWSRISPTMITSGRRAGRPHGVGEGEVDLGVCTCTWRRPAWVISTGSSAVQIFMSTV